LDTGQSSIIHPSNYNEEECNHIAIKIRRDRTGEVEKEKGTKNKVKGIDL
jgi:hypothetical protein